MNGRIDWMEMIVNALPDYPDGIIWSDGGVKEVFNGNDLRQIPYGIGCKELAYIYSECDGSESCTCYEVNQE